MRLPIFLDTDPGIDDAVAIAAAIFAPELDLQLMTTVAGNVSVEKTTRNALQLLHFWNAEIPLAQGAAVPLVRAPRDAASVHGESGMAGYDFVEHNRKPLGIPAFLAIRDALMRAPEPVTLVAIGPLTNIALLLSQCPECKPCNCCISGMRRFRSPKGPLCHWYAHRVMRHLCTANREWLATTLLSTTESRSGYRRFWRFGMP